MLQRLIVVLVGEILDAELVAKVQVVRIALDALREVIEDELVLLPLEIGDTFLVALGAALLDELVVIEDRGLGQHTVEFGIHRTGGLNGLVEAVDGLFVALVLIVESGERATRVHVLRLLLDLRELFGNERLGVVAGDDRLVGGIELLGLLLVGDQRLEAALLASRLFPAGVHRGLCLGVLEKGENALIARLHLGELLVGVARLGPVLRHLVVGRHALEEGRILVAALIGGLHGNRGVVRLARALGGLHGGLDVVGIERILTQELLGFGHGLGTLALLDEAHDLLTGHHITELGAEADLAVAAEVGNLRRAEELTGLQYVRSRRDGFHQHVHRQFEAARFEGLTSAVRKVLSLLCKINCHNRYAMERLRFGETNDPALRA